MGLQRVRHDLVTKQQLREHTLLLLPDAVVVPFPFLEHMDTVFPSLQVTSAKRLPSVLFSEDTPATVPMQIHLVSMGFSRHEYWSGSPFPSPGDLPSRPRDQTLVSRIAGRFFTI